MRRIPLLLLAGLGGCVLDDPTVELEVQPLTTEERDAWTAAGVSSAHHEVVVQRVFQAASECSGLSGDAVRTGTVITLRVIAERQDRPGCRTGVKGLFAYRAVLRGIRTGRYELRVIHTPADPRRPARVVLEHPILVE